jgi:hypothetical protein
MAATPRHRQCYKTQRAYCGWTPSSLHQGSEYVPEVEIMAPSLPPSTNLAAQDPTLHTTLSRGPSIGLAFDTEAGLLSAIAAFIILILISVSLEHFRINSVI